MIILGLLAIAGLCIAIAYAVWAVGERNTARRELEQKEQSATQLSEQVAELDAERAELRIEMRAREERLRAEQRCVEERDIELGRLRKLQDESRETVGEQSTEIKRLKDVIESFKEEQDKLRENTLEAAQRNQRIESTLLDWTRQISAPQGRGAFGELALRNQLLSLGLEEGRDFDKQVTSEANGGRRVDYVVRLGDPTVAIDSKLANDPGLAGLSEALAAGDPEHLREFGRKLRDHATALSKKDYWRGLERSPSLTLMYVPVEGAQYALAAVEGFDPTKFFNRHRVCVITPSQLATALVLIAEVCHAERKEARIEDLLERGYTMAEAIGAFLDNYATLGKNLGKAVNSFNSGAAMTTAHGKLWQQVVKPLSELAPGQEVKAKVIELEPPRDDVPELADRYHRTAEEMNRREPDSARETLPEATGEAGGGKQEAA